MLGINPRKKFGDFNMQLELNFKLNSKSNQYLLVQWYQGYGDSLLDYNKYSSMIRVGICIKPPLRNLYWKFFSDNRNTTSSSKKAANANKLNSNNKPLKRKWYESDRHTPPKKYIHSWSNFLVLKIMFMTQYINQIIKKMKRFISTKFLRTLQEALLKNVNVDTDVIKNEYVEFAAFVFSEFSNLSDRTAYRNALAYTLSELKGMAKQVSHKDGFF